MTLADPITVSRYLGLSDSSQEEIGALDPTVRLGNAQPLALGPEIPLNSLRGLGPYRFIKQLGSGGMGIVFEAEDRISGGQFAVKVLRPSLAMETEAKQRFFREAQAMATIAHPRIVPVIRVGEDQGIPYIAMPLLRGETLENRMQHQPELSINEIVRIGIEIAEGLEAAHRRGLIHRDIKPANVWLEDPFGGVRLLDLGLVREITKETLLTQTGLVMGTPSYMSPEQGRGQTLDARSDLFSLGSLLYEMTSGRRPFEGPLAINILQQLEAHHPPRVTALKPTVPTMLSNLIMEMLAKNPKDRPESAALVMERLRRIPLHDHDHRPPPVVAPSPLLRAYTPLSEDEEEYQPARHTFAGAEFIKLSLLLAAVGGFCYLTLR